jgi:hypothetical protein
MKAYEFNFKTNTGRFEIGVDNEQAYGYFEHNELGDECGGGLWFAKKDNKLELEDYDGVYQLPAEVCDALVANGYILDPIFYP